MARTKAQIKADMLAAVAGSTVLSGLSTSATGVWMQLVDAIVSVLQISEQLGDVQEARLNTIADQAVPGTPAWLQRQVFNWQFGDQIQINADFSISYAEPDATKRLVTRCSVQEVSQDRQVLVKVAKGSTNTTLEPLAADELASLRGYLQRIKYAGTYLLPISLNSDKITSEVTVYYDAQYVAADVKAAVIAAVQNYYANIAFDGTFFLSKLQDTIQGVQGVTDVVLRTVSARADTTPQGSPGIQPIARTYQAQSGYLTAESTAGYTLEDTISLIPA